MIGHGPRDRALPWVGGLRSQVAAKAPALTPAYATGALPIGCAISEMPSEAQRASRVAGGLR